MAALIQYNHMFHTMPWDKNSKKKISNTKVVFQPYTSFDNHYHKKTSEFLKLPGANLPHIVREKIDGAHFSIMYDEGAIKFCRRKGILQLGESFRGYDKCYESINPDIEKILKNPIRGVSLRTELIEKASCLFSTFGTHLVLHGELFGNSWDCLSIQKKDFAAFQTKVEYTPTLEVLWYDIWDSKNNSYLPLEKANKIFELSNFPTAPIIATYPNLKLALEHNEEFSSKIPPMFLNIKHSKPNMAEGIVITPIEPYYYKSNRAIIKKKNKAFLEVSKTSNSSQKKNEFQFLDNYCAGEAGENRFTNVKSKLADDVSKSSIVTEFIWDVLSDLPEDSPYSTFSIIQKRQAEKYIKKKIGYLVAKI